VVVAADADHEEVIPAGISLLSVEEGFYRFNNSNSLGGKGRGATAFERAEGLVQTRG